eukprot:2504835-Rhodomonas_salina.4
MASLRRLLLRRDAELAPTSYEFLVIGYSQDPMIPLQCVLLRRGWNSFLSPRDPCNPCNRPTRPRARDSRWARDVEVLGT